MPMLLLAYACFYGLPLLPIILAIGPAVTARSWLVFGKIVVLTTLSIAFPLFIFLMSGFLLPSSQSDCPHGWLDCFHIGKLALTPLVIWACAAFHQFEVLKRHSTPPWWITGGLGMGAMVGGICLLAGCVVHLSPDRFSTQYISAPSVFLIVPWYVTVWFLMAYFRSHSLAHHSRRDIFSLVGSAPLWIIGIAWSHSNFRSLPVTRPPSDCFVVTASQSGHRQVVGRQVPVEHSGRQRWANQQLRTFWRFEELWATTLPATHGIFRKIYNRIGPEIAHRIDSPLKADMTYLLLKPFEKLATLLLAVVSR